MNLSRRKFIGLIAAIPLASLFLSKQRPKFTKLSQREHVIYYMQMERLKSDLSLIKRLGEDAPVADRAFWRKAYAEAAKQLGTA